MRPEIRNDEVETQIINVMKTLYNVSKKDDWDLTNVLKSMIRVVDAYPDAPWKKEPIIEKIRREFGA